MSNEKINFIKKLTTPKIVGGKILARELDTENDNDLYQVVGVASGIKTGTTDFGEWVALTGNFAAVNIKTGEKFRAGVCFLPDVALDPIKGQLDTGANAVEFGYTIGVRVDDTVTVGYAYYAKPIFEADENDPLEQLVSRMTAPALEDKTKGEETKAKAKAKAKAEK